MHFFFWSLSRAWGASGGACGARCGRKMALDGTDSDWYIQVTMVFCNTANSKIHLLMT